MEVDPREVEEKEQSLLLLKKTGSTEMKASEAKGEKKTESKGEKKAESKEEKKTEAKAEGKDEVKSLDDAEEDKAVLVLVAQGADVKGNEGQKITVPRKVGMVSHLVTTMAEGDTDSSQESG
jgi:hypothetical protein